MGSSPCGNKHCYAIKNEQVWVVGDNTYGQLGLNPNLVKKVHKWKETSFKAVKVEAGSFNGYALTSNNEVFSIGWNKYGQLGVGDYINRISWVNTGLVADDILSYSGSGFALQKNKILAVGSNFYGTLKINDKIDRNAWTHTGLKSTIYKWKKVVLF